MAPPNLSKARRSSDDGMFWSLPGVTFLYNVLTEFITEHRGIFIVVVVLPISLVWDLFFYARAKIIMMMFSAPKLHQQRVENVANQVVEWKKKNKGTRLVTARGGWQSMSPGYRDYKSKATKISVNLYDILELDEESMTVKCEPMVNMGQLTHFLVPRGYVVPVLPEMDDLTVGGLLMGVGIETSSHVYGLFNDCVLEAEIVLADGSVVTCSKTDRRDLFDALPWSYGTLGLLVSATIRIVKCKPFLRLEYHPFKSVDREEYMNFFETECCGEDPPQFVEALEYSPTDCVVMTANFCDADSVEYSKKNTWSLWYKPWFFKHVESILNRNQHRVEYVDLRSYMHRHTRSIFWELQDLIPWGNNFVFRFLFGWAVPPKVSFLKITQTKAIEKLQNETHVIQDFLVPMSKLVEASGFFDEATYVFPRWVCPHRHYDLSDDQAPHRHFLRAPEELLPGKDYEMYVDIGLYGIPKAVRNKEFFDISATTRSMERYVTSVRGFQMLYATSFLTRSEFRRMFDHEHYDEMKAKYDPDGAFPEVWEKTCLKARAKWGMDAARIGVRNAPDNVVVTSRGRSPAMRRRTRASSDDA